MLVILIEFSLTGGGLDIQKPGLFPVRKNSCRISMEKR